MHASLLFGNLDKIRSSLSNIWAYFVNRQPQCIDEIYLDAKHETNRRIMPLTFWCTMHYCKLYHSHDYYYYVVSASERHSSNKSSIIKKSIDEIFSCYNFFPCGCGYSIGFNLGLSVDQRSLHGTVAFFHGHEVRHCLVRMVGHS